jgi:hypothetical protein
VNKRIAIKGSFKADGARNFHGLSAVLERLVQMASKTCHGVPLSEVHREDRMVEESESETHECGRRGIAAVNTLGVRDSQQGTILHQAFILVVGTGSTEKKQSNTSKSPQIWW